MPCVVVVGVVVVVVGVDVVSVVVVAVVSAATNKKWRKDFNRPTQDMLFTFYILFTLLPVLVFKVHYNLYFCI